MPSITWVKKNRKLNNPETIGRIKCDYPPPPKCTQLFPERFPVVDDGSKGRDPKSSIRQSLGNSAEDREKEIKS